MKPLLQFNGVSYVYHTPQGETPALSDLSFSLYPGEFLSIVGPSGCGKSTLLSLIAGLITPSSGTITMEASHKIGYMLQKDHLFEWCNIEKNVALGPRIAHTPRMDWDDCITNLLSVYGLTGFRYAKPSQLSGGMRQRAALIRTLALSPDLLLLDEPFSALDYQTRLEVCDDIYAIIKNEKKSAILVTHDLAEAISVGDRVLVLGHRPARVQADIPISFAMEKRVPFACRNAPEFKIYFNEIWKELKSDGN